MLNSLIVITRAGGSIGIPGLYVTEDPGSKDEAAQQGNLRMRTGTDLARCRVSRACSPGSNDKSRQSQSSLPGRLESSTSLCPALPARRSDGARDPKCHGMAAAHGARFRFGECAQAGLAGPVVSTCG